MKGGSPQWPITTIVAYLEALPPGSRLDHTALDAVGPNDHHARSHNHANALDGSPIALAGLPALTGRVTTGGYTGNNTANRAIPHGLGKTPATVFLYLLPTYAMWFRILGSQARVIYINNTPTLSSVVVTQPNGTNFYVGNDPSFGYGANGNALVYEWVAISAS